VADPSFDTYSFDPDAGREGSYTFMRADGTARTVANTPYAAQLAADIDARKVKPAVDLTGPLLMPDPMAGMARAEQVQAARVAPEFRPAYDALSGSAPLPDLDAFAAKMQALDAQRAAPAPAPQVVDAFGPRPAPIDMNAVVGKLKAVGKPAPAPMADAPDLMAMETGYRRQGPFDMRRFAVDGAPASGGETPWYDRPFNEGLKSMPVVGPVVSQLAAATRNTARVNFGIGVEPPSAPQVTPPLATPSANTGPDAEAQLLASQAPAPEPGTSEPGPMASMAPLAVSRAPAMSVAAPVAQEPAAPQAPLPASAVPVGRTVNPTQSTGQRIDAQIDRMMAPQFALAQRQGDVNEQAASGDADFAQDRAAIGLQRDEADAARRATQARREEQAYQSISRAADEVTAKQYDPDRYFKQRGPGAVVLASLAVAMGELGRGLQRTGGPNTALQVVNDAIERDLAAQREEYARAKDKLSLTSNAYAQLRQRGLDDEAAASQARAGALSAVASRAEAFRAGMKTDQAKLDADAAAQKLRDQADGMKAQARAQMAAQAANAAAAQASSAARARKEALAEAKTAAEIEKLEAEAGKARGEARGEKLLVPDGRGGTFQAPSAEEARNLSNKAELTAGVARNAAVIERVTSQWSRGALSPADSRDYSRAVEWLVNNANTLQQQGVVRGDDIERAKSFVPGQYSINAAQSARSLANAAVQYYRDAVDVRRGTGLPGVFTPELPGSAQKVGE
jgi:hypothetical protein